MKAASNSGNEKIMPAAVRFISKVRIGKRLMILIVLLLCAIVLPVSILIIEFNRSLGTYNDVLENLENIRYIMTETESQGDRILGYCVIRKNIDESGETGIIIRMRNKLAKIEENLGSDGRYPENKAKLDVIKNLFEDYVSNYKEGIEVCGDEFSLSGAESFYSMMTTADYLSKNCRSFLSLELKRSTDLKIQIADEARARIITALVISTVIIVTTLILSAVIRSSIVLPVKLLQKRITVVADGDLSAEPIDLGTNDELQEVSAAFNTMKDNLTEAFDKIQHHVEREQDAYKMLESRNSDIVKTLVRIIDAKDRYTNGHSQRVANYAKEIAARMGKSDEEQQTIYYAGLMHDVGKIRIPDGIINKSGKLTDEEFMHIKTHPITGYYILKEIYKDAVIINSAKYHHERYDGRGYPVGLKGDIIPEAARIVGVADAYDAMASDRSYRRALPQETVRSEIEKGRGTQFDPAIADIMLEMIDEDKEYRMRQAEPMDRTLLIIGSDDESAANITGIFDQLEHYSVISIKILDEGLRCISEMPVDLVMLDNRVTGSHIERIISRIHEIKQIPVIVMTNDKLMTSSVRPSRLGAADYIAKPVSAYALIEIVHGILG